VEEEQEVVVEHSTTSIILRRRLEGPDAMVVEKRRRIPGLSSSKSVSLLPPMCAALDLAPTILFRSFVCCCCYCPRYLHKLASASDEIQIPTLPTVPTLPVSPRPMLLLLLLCESVVEKAPPTRRQAPTTSPSGW